MAGAVKLFDCTSLSEWGGKGNHAAGSSIRQLRFMHTIGFHCSWTVTMMVRPLSSMVAVLPVCDSVVSAGFP